MSDAAEIPEDWRPPIVQALNQGLWGDNVRVDPRGPNGLVIQTNLTYVDHSALEKVVEVAIASLTKRLVELDDISRKSITSNIVMVDANGVQTEIKLTASDIQAAAERVGVELHNARRIAGLIKRGYR